MRSCAGLPDIMIFEPRKQKAGMFLEVKKEGTKIYKKKRRFKKRQTPKRTGKYITPIKTKGIFCRICSWV